jgi:hypothetical protein
MKASPDIAQRARALVDTLGLAEAAAHLGISTESLKSVAARFDVRAGTLALVQANINKPHKKKKVEK